MGDPSFKVHKASYWDDLPFQLPPLPFKGRVRRTLTDVICLVGMTVAKVAGALQPDRKDIAPGKILVVRRGGLGDALMMTPLLRGLREHFPSARVYVLTAKQAVAGLQGSPWV